MNLTLHFFWILYLNILRSILSPSLIKCVHLATFLSFSGPHIPHLENGDDFYLTFSELLQGFRVQEWKHLAQHSVQTGPPNFPCLPLLPKSLLSSLPPPKHTGSTKDALDLNVLNSLLLRVVV